MTSYENRLQQFWIVYSDATSRLCPVDMYTYLLTLWCRVLLEKLTGLQLVKKFPTFHGTRRFITTLTSVRHLSLSWASPIQSIYTHPTWRSILILSTDLRLGLPSGLLLSGFPTKTLYTPSPHTYAPHAQPISFFSILCSVIFFFENLVYYGVMWKSILQPDRAQTTIWRMRIACWTTKVTNTHRIRNTYGPFPLQ